MDYKSIIEVVDSCVLLAAGFTREEAIQLLGTLPGPFAQLDQLSQVKYGRK